MAVAALPGAVAAAEVWDLLGLIEASAAIPVSLLAGIGAIMLARGARERIRRTIGRVGGARLAWIGRTLGALGVALALSGSIAVGFYLFLERIADQ